ncbi:hypothetical protein JHK84_040327 [Glycine max]|nr:hypothetical protein JHK84_040327 [Glycine max]
MSLFEMGPESYGTTMVSRKRQPVAFALWIAAKPDVFHWDKPWDPDITFGSHAKGDLWSLSRAVCGSFRTRPDDTIGVGDSLGFIVRATPAWACRPPTCEAGVVQADFSFFDPKPNDFLVAKTLLQTYLDDQEWDLIAFVDLILAQTTVGSVVKIEDDDDEGLFEHKCIATVKDFLLLKARRQEKGVDDRLRLLLGEQARDVGLLEIRRVSPPTFENLHMSLLRIFYWLKLGLTKGYLALSNFYVAVCDDEQDPTQQTVIDNLMVQQLDGTVNEWG